VRQEVVDADQSFLVVAGALLPTIFFLSKIYGVAQGSWSIHHRMPADCRQIGGPTKGQCSRTTLSILGYREFRMWSSGVSFVC
jgi:hypothetical protein